MAQLIDGKKIAQEIQQELRKELERLKARGVVPGLAVILVGENPASLSYVRMKEKACQELGMTSRTVKLPDTISQEELLRQIKLLAIGQEVHGLLVQLPLPSHLSEDLAISNIPPEKDVDGFHPLNRGRLALGEDTLTPCTPAGIVELLLRSGHSPENKHVVIVGRSRIVGMPLAQMLMQKKKGANATVTVCHTGTRNLKFYTQQADILVAALGQPEVIRGDMLKEGVVVIDVGVNRIADATTKSGYRLVGDVHFPSASEVAKAISPVPGGVGPMTVVMLMKNTIKAAFLTIDENWRQ